MEEVEEGYFLVIGDSVEERKDGVTLVPVTGMERSAVVCDLPGRRGGRGAVAQPKDKIR